MDATEALKKLAAEWQPKNQPKPAQDGPDLSAYERLYKKAALGVIPKPETLSQKKLGGMRKHAIADQMGQANKMSLDSGTTGTEMDMATLQDLMPPPPPPPPPAPQPDMNADV